MAKLCGWLGYGPDAGDARQALLQMVTAPSDTSSSEAVLLVRGFSGLGASRVSERVAFVDDEILAIIDGSPIYTDAELDQVAQRAGTAAALVAGYRKTGTGVLQSLYGSFSLALVNYREETAFLAVDRLGIHSMTATVAGCCLVFGSSAQAVKTHPLVKTSVDPQAIFDYVYFHVVPAPNCIYKDFVRLLPGTYLLFSRGSLTTDTYWMMDYTHTSSASFISLKEELLHLLEQSVRRRADDKHPGAFLSGGTDSSTVAGMLGCVTGQPALTYSIGFDAKGYDEMEYARITARHFRTEHHEYYVTPTDVIDAIPAIAGAYGNPYGNSSAVPAYYCARRAKEDHVDVLLAGDGGDELFGGNARYARQWLFSLYDRVPRGLRESLVEPLIFAIPAGERLPGVHKLRSYIRQASLPMPERLESYNLLGHVGSEELFSSGFLCEVDQQHPTALLRQMYQEVRADDIVNRMMGLDLRITLADNDLPKVTRMCELAGVEARFPLLDDELVSFAARLPVTFKLKRTQLRFFFKQALRDFLPVATLSKRKHGFGLPFGIWLHSNRKLQEFAADNLGELAARGIIRKRFVDDLMRTLLPRHPQYYGTLAWVLMMLEQWFQRHVDRQPVGHRAHNSAASVRETDWGSGPKE
jgi:asparagine synthase (glutamine-hydrolysing)